MKLASLKGGRDGRLVVVSNDLAWFTEAHHIAPTLQAALDHWAGVEPVLRGLAESLELGAVPTLGVVPVRQRPGVAEAGDAGTQVKLGARHQRPEEALRVALVEVLDGPQARHRVADELGRLAALRHGRLEFRGHPLQLLREGPDLLDLLAVPAAALRRGA